MRVLLKMTLDCEPDAAWRAIRRPSVLNEVSSPLSRFVSLEEDGFPELWPEGPHPVRMLAANSLVVGDQVIDVSYIVKPGRGDEPRVRIMRDFGHGLSGPLAIPTRWEHSMAISAAPGNKTLYRDQLVFEAGLLTPVLWPAYWSFWQWRASGIRRLAPTWRA